MEASPDRSSRLAQLAAAVAAASLVLVMIALLGVQVDLFAPMTAFLFFAVGALLGGLLSLLLGLVGLFVTRGGGDPQGAKRAISAGAVGLALLVAVAIGASAGSGAPAINDISTDLDDPPALNAASRAPANADRDMSYPPDFKAVVRESYPDLQTTELDVPASACFERALTVAAALGWQLVERDPAAGTFEAEDRSALFHFVDDIAVRVRPSGNDCRVDMRSKSRDGKSDLGANAKRIRAFGAALEAAAPASR
jgi:hypothetical protein